MVVVTRTSPLSERITRLETLFETSLSHQTRRDEELRDSITLLLVRLEKFEPVILGDKTLGQRSLGERLEAVEQVVLSAKIGWRVATVISAALVSLVSALTCLAQSLPAAWLSHP